MFIIIWKDKLLIINQKANFNSGSALKFIYFYKNIVIQGGREQNRYHIYLENLQKYPCLGSIPEQWDQNLWGGVQAGVLFHSSPVWKPVH